MIKYLTLLMCALLLAAIPSSAESPAADTFFQDEEEGLGVPDFTNLAFPIYENEIILSYFNPNEGSQTEIYISLSPDSGFELAQVGPAGDEVYYDDTRLPRRTYYVKLRAVKGDLVSDFSSVKSFTTGSKFYPPELTGKATGPGVIELTFTDRSYNDISYDIIGPEFHKPITAPDSGQVFHFTDDFLEPATTYNYRVDAYTQGPNQPRYIGLLYLTITTPPGPSIYVLTLVDADTDQEVSSLYEGIRVVAPEHPNIDALASPGTGSVVMFLNGRKRIEKEAPYAFFYDAKGDYHPGDLPPGDYELIAIPYTGDYGDGVAGGGLKINFTVIPAENSLMISGFTLIDPDTNEDIGELQDGDVVDASMRPNIRANTGDETESVVMFLNGIKRTENEAPYAYFYDTKGDYEPGRLKEGSYVLEATAYSGNNGTGAHGNTATIHFTVADPAAQVITSLEVYPNPVVNSSTLDVSGPAESNVVIEVMDQLGYQRSMIYEGVLDRGGYLRRQIDASQFAKGNYIIIVRMEDQVKTKKFIIK